MNNYSEQNNQADYLIKKYGSMIYKVAFTYCRNKSDTDDIYQEVFINYFKHNPKFESDEHEKAWFIRVTINCCKNFLNSGWNKKTIGLNYDDLDCEELFHYEEKSELFFAVMELPQKYREVIHLFYYEGYTVKEIAKFFDRKESAVTTQLDRGRKLLKQKLKGEVQL